MDVQAVLEQARDILTVRRVYGEPFERDGVTVIPAARVQGGGGGGGGENQEGEERNSGSGVGFGAKAIPTGAFVIRDGRVRWQPAVDVNRVALGGQVVVIVALLVLREVLRARRAC